MDGAKNFFLLKKHFLPIYLKKIFFFKFLFFRNSLFAARWLANLAEMDGCKEMAGQCPDNGREQCWAARGTPGGPFWRRRKICSGFAIF
jgi:hypothetical protein